MSQHRVLLEVDTDGTWLVRALDIQGCHSYGRSLSEARKNIREAIALFADDPDDIQLVEVHRLPRPVRTAVTACRRARQEAEAAGDVALRVTSSTAQLLSQEIGLGVRDIGEILGISYQRVAQLLSGETA